MSFNGSRNDLMTYMQYINKNMLNANVSCSLLGGGELEKMVSSLDAANIIQYTPTTRVGKFVGEVLTDGETVSTPAPPTFANASTQGTASIIRVKNNNTLQNLNTVTGSAQASGDVTAANLPDTVLDINLVSWLDNTVGSPSAASRAIYQKLYFIHDLFHAENWSKWKSGSTIFLQGVDISGAIRSAASDRAKLVSSGYQPADPNAEYNILTEAKTGSKKAYIRISDLENIGGDNREKIPLSTLKTMDNLNILLLRRIFYLWIRLACNRIAAISTSSSKTLVLKTNYLILERTNKNVEMSNSDENTFSQTVIRELANKQSILRYNIATINQYSTNMQLQQKKAFQAKDDVIANQKLEKKIKTFEYISLALLGFVFIATLALTGLPDMTKDMRLKASFGVLIFASVVISTILLIYTKEFKEGFAVLNSTAMMGAARTATYSDTTKDAFMKQAALFAENTVTIVSFLDSYDLSLNMNRVMTEDQTKYSGLNNDLQVVARRLDDMTKYVDLQRVQRSSRVYLYITLTMILAVMLPLYVWAEEYPSVRIGMLVISGTLALIAMVIHAYDTTSIVRTDGQKRYWGQPAAFAVKNT